MKYHYGEALQGGRGSVIRPRTGGRSVTDDVVARVAERLEPLELASGPALARCTHSSGVAPWESEREPLILSENEYGEHSGKVM